MDCQFFENPYWYRATTLTERSATLTDKQNHRYINTDLAKQRLESWQQQSPFNTHALFAERLAMDNVTESQLRSLLGESIEATKERFSETPDWLQQIAQAFNHTATSHAQPFWLSQFIQSTVDNSFVALVEPLIHQGCQRVLDRMENLHREQTDLPFNSQEAIKLLLPILTFNLATIMTRTLVLEINILRIQGLLDGNTPETRFQSFIARLRQPEIALELLQEYPVLARQITLFITHWVTFSLEFLQHLCADWDDIKTTFSPEQHPGILTGLQGQAGDRHQQGRSVFIATFSSGLQLVYKPRSLAVDTHFQLFLSWLNERSDWLSFRTLKILNRETYGWMEFVKAEGCTTRDEVQRFYERQGGYLALLYALQATDCHSENLIAAGEHPIFIDLESLFHPTVGKLDTSKADLAAGEKMAYSVLRIGLLPQRIWENDERDGVDLSGLGAPEGQITPNEFPYWSSRGTDEMRLAYGRMELPGHQNRPKLNGQEIHLLDYEESLLTGFMHIYQLLTIHRDALLADDGPIAAFAEDDVRAILRVTRLYAFLLDASFHPDLLRDALDRDRHFDRIWFYTQQQPWLKQAIAAERAELLCGDIPMFKTRPNSQDVWISSGQRLKGLLKEPCLHTVYRRLRQFSEADMAQQLWFIRASLATVHLGLNDVSFPTYPLTAPEAPADPEHLLSAACAIGDRLEELALHGEHDVSWIGLRFVGERQWSLVALGLDLYNGIPGIALFLAYLGAMTGEQRYTALARRALKTVQHLRKEYELLEEDQLGTRYIGAFGGQGGMIYMLTHLGVLWQEADLLSEAERMVETLFPLIEQDEQLDMISGAAGCIASLLCLYHYRPSPTTLAAATLCGDRLISQAEPMAHGLGWHWRSENFEEIPLAGFSHGAAGITSALLELADVTGEQRFTKTALAGIEYERSLFLPDEGTWSDLRRATESAEDNYQLCAWCHGAPGVGLARLRSLRHLDSDAVRSEIDIALNTTLAKGFGQNHSLCHGDLGNLDLLLQASQTFDDPHWKAHVSRLSATILESISKHGWLCGVPGGLETPGLMTGLAGIGYGLLRLAEPARVPSVLMLEPPTPKLVALEPHAQATA